MQNKLNLSNMERIALADTSRQRIQQWLIKLDKKTPLVLLQTMHKIRNVQI